MKREEAKTILYEWQEMMVKHGVPIDTSKVQALRVAIEALSQPNYETDTEVRLAVTDRNKDKVVLWDAFGEVEYYQQTTSHGRLIDADTLSKKLCGTTIFIKDGEVFQRMINDAPTVPVVDITQRDLCADISCTDCPFMQETCKLMDYVAYADRPHGEWEFIEGDYWCNKCGYHQMRVDGFNFCPKCGADMRKENK